MPWLVSVGRRVPTRPSGYVAPTPEDLELFRAVLHEIREDDWATADALARELGYGVSVVHDVGDEEELIAILWPATRDQGRGWYVFRPGGGVQHPLVVEIPHPKVDPGTAAVGGLLFREGRGRALALAGAHRCASRTPIACTGRTRVCGGYGRFRTSDAAHAPGTFFQAFHEVFQDEVPGVTVTVQVHGFAARGGSAPAFSISDGTYDNVHDPTYLPNWVATELNRRLRDVGWKKRGGSCNRLADPKFLCSSSNMQARYSNGVPEELLCRVEAQRATGRFLHVEMGRRLRLGKKRVGPSLVAGAILSTLGGR